MDTIPQSHLDDILREVHSSTLKAPHKAYIKGLFDQHASGGISKKEVHKAIRQLKTDLHDNIDRHTAAKVEKALLSHLGGEANEDDKE